MQYSSFLQNKKVLIVGGVIALILLVSLISGLATSLLAPAQSGNSTANGTADSSGRPANTLFGSKKVAAPTFEPTDVPYVPTNTPGPTRAPEDYLLPTEIPTPTPYPGVFYIANGKQNDLQITYVHQHTGDTFDEIHLKNTKTTEERLLGYIYHYTPGDPAFFSKDFSQVYFIGSMDQNEYNQISTYSIAQNKIVKSIKLSDLKKALPQLQLDQVAALSMLMPSPDKSKMALSYGITFSPDQINANTSIIVIDLNHGSMQLLPVHGLVHGWKDNTTLQYDNNTPDLNGITTQEVQLSGI